MTHRISKIWILVTVIWMGVFLLTCWNVRKIDQIRDLRERRVTLRMDEQFLTHNSENLSKVLKKAELFYQSIENRKLGLLTAEDELRALAAKHYFTNVKINRHEGGNASEGIVGVTLSFKGSLQGIVKWLRAICRDFPYIPVTGIRMRIEGPRAQAEFQVFLNYRYRITSTGSSA